MRKQSKVLSPGVYLIIPFFAADLSASQPLHLLLLLSCHQDPFIFFRFLLGAISALFAAISRGLLILLIVSQRWIIFSSLHLTWSTFESPVSIKAKLTLDSFIPPPASLFCNYDFEFKSFGMDFLASFTQFLSRMP